MRQDLAALSDPVLVSLANRGLVKRAHKMLAKEQGPRVVWEADTPVGTYPDGVVTRLQPDTPLVETSCSCGATTVCRHRIALVIALRSADAEPKEAWTPAEFDDALLLERLGKRLIARADRRERKGLVVEVLDDGAPTARLPTCTVRFLVPHDLAYAKCDCDVPELCEHVALAVRAFRAADRVPGTVELGRRDEVDTAALEQLVELSRELLGEGIVNAPASLAQRFAVVRSGLAGQVWPLDLCEDTEDLVEAYRSRSARYRSSQAAELLVEPTARLRAARADGGTPPGRVLGTTVAPETALEKLSLVALGCRVEAFDRLRQAEVFLADAATGTVVVLRKSWSAREGEEPMTAPQLARRVVGGGVKLGAMASAQVITQVAKRRANRLLVLGGGRQNTSATPQRGDWDKLPAPLFVESLGELAAHRRARPPRMLRPRLLAENLVVLPIEAVVSARWAAGEQAVIAQLLTRGGDLVELVKVHRSVVPGACASLAKALHGEIRYVAGELVGGVLDPLSVVTAEGVLVPELAPSAPVRLAGAVVEAHSDPLGAGLREGLGLLAEGAHSGLSALPRSWARRVEENARVLQERGLGRCSKHMSAAATASRRAASGGDLDGLVDAWLDARIRLEIAAERL